MNYTIAEIANLAGGQLTGAGVGSIGYVLTDSRSLLYPARTVFFAIPGKRRNGSDYVGELYRQGVRCFVTGSGADDGQQAFPEAGFIRVPDVLHSLQRLAAGHRRRFITPVIGVAGSNGKTVV
jgi:alanine racemase